MTSLPALEYAVSPCPQCGAATALEAETKCTATQQMSGDYECAGTDCKEDKDGRFMFPTAASLAEQDKWYDAEGTKLHEAEQRAIERAKARGHKDPDALIVCRGGIKQPVWMFYLDGAEPLPNHGQSANRDEKDF